MKKGLVGLVIGIGLYLGLSGCGNRQIIDTSWNYNRAIITLGEEIIEVEVSSWKDFDDTSIQIKSKDGQVYLTDIKNVLLIKE